MRGIFAKLRRIDPDLRAVRRAARLTVAASVGFYLARYVFDSRVMATYAFFGVLGLGYLGRVPGSSKQRAQALFACLPAAWLLVIAGTMLAVTNLAAAAGMLVVGFVVSYTGVGGPRLVGVATGLEIFFVLSCFPPFAPDTVGERLLGVTIGVVLLACAELVLWPDPGPEPYRLRLARAVAALARCLPGPAPAQDIDRATGDARTAIRISQLPLDVRPVAANRRDRALLHAGELVRFTFGRIAELSTVAPAATHPAVQRLLRAAHDGARRTEENLRGTGPPPDAATATAVAEFRSARARTVPDTVDAQRLRAGSLSLAIGDGIAALATAVRVSSGERVTNDPSFWYASRSELSLYWMRLRYHLTPRSVYFQGAVRLAIALAVGRLLVGELDLAHGFWALLAIISVLRPTVVQTRTMLWQALLGTAIGALLAGAALVLVRDDRVFTIAFPVMMFIAFSARQLFGPVAGQAAYTLVIAASYVQLEPSNWRLAETRLVDVALGGAIGLLIGVCAWPRGGTGEMHRVGADFLGRCAAAVRETVQALAAPPSGAASDEETLVWARQGGQLAEASYSLYQTEPRTHGSTVDWQAALVAGHHVVRGAEALHRIVPPGDLSGRAAALTERAAAVAARCGEVAAILAGRRAVPLSPPIPRSNEWQPGLGPRMYHLADVRAWLDSVDADLTPITAPAAAESPPLRGPASIPP